MWEEETEAKKKNKIVEHLSLLHISCHNFSCLMYWGRGVRHDILFDLPFLVNVLFKIHLIILSKLSCSCALAFLISSPCVQSTVTSVRNMKNPGNSCLPELLKEISFLHFVPLLRGARKLHLPSHQQCRKSLTKIMLYSDVDNPHTKSLFTHRLPPAVLTMISVNTCHSTVSPFWCWHIFIHLHNCPDKNGDLGGLVTALRFGHSFFTRSQCSTRPGVRQSLLHQYF